MVRVLIYTDISGVGRGSYMRRLITLLVFLIIWSNLTGQQIDSKYKESGYFGEYLGLEIPDSIPEIFAPGLISGIGRMHSFLTFSPDMKMILWATIPPKIMMIQMIDNKWTSPETASFQILIITNHLLFLLITQSIFHRHDQAD